MGYIFALLSVFFGNAKGFSGKKVSGFTEKINDAMFFNALRMLFCIVIAFAMIAAQGDILSLKVSGEFLFIGMLSGIFTSVSVVSWLLSVKGEAYMLVEVFVMLGTVVTLILSAVIYKEAISLPQFFGVLLLFAAVLIMCSYNRSVKSSKISVKAWIFLILCSISFGFSDFSQKMFAKVFPDGSIAIFNFYTYIASAAVLLICSFILSAGKPTNSKNISKGFGYMLLMSLFLFLNSFFKTKAALYLPAVQLYPLANSLSLTGSLLMSALFFKEKLTAKCIFGMLLSLAAIMIISFT